MVYNSRLTVREKYFLFGLHLNRICLHNGALSNPKQDGYLRMRASQPAILADDNPNLTRIGEIGLYSLEPG